MCGIAGIRRYGKPPIEEHMIRLLLTASEHRGNDATGIAMQNKKGDVFSYKDDIQAWNFVSSKGYHDWIKEFLTEDIDQVILHTRAATKGSPRKMENNHPLTAGKACIVHNGKIENDDEVFRTMKLDRKADTDTDIVRAIIDRFGITPDAINELKNVRGSAAIAALSPDYPGKMLLGRSGSPLSIGSTEDFFIFASEKNTIHRAMRPLFMRFGILFREQSLGMGFSPYPDNTLWIMGPEGQEFFGEFKSYWGTYKDPVRRVYTGYKERQDEWTKKANMIKDYSKPTLPPQGFVPTHNVALLGPQLMEHKNVGEKILLSCPNCQKPLVLGKAQMTMDLRMLTCPADKGGCGKPLTGARVN